MLPRSDRAYDQLLMRELLAVVAAVAVPLTLPLLPAVPAAPAAAMPDAPDLGGFQSTPAQPFLEGGELYFQTPGGLLCAIRPTVGRAGCDGALPGAPTAANEIALAADQPSRGLRATSAPQFVKSTGAAAPVLQAGHKVALADFECAVADDGAGKVLCTKGTPSAHWLVISSAGTGVGPATAGLPAGVPDPNAFIGSDDSYRVGSGPRNIFPVFTVSGGLSCKMALFSGGEIGCNGKLPGISNGDDEVFAQLPGKVGTRKAGNPPISSPVFPGTVRELPAGFRIDDYGATCMATDDGGVTCVGAAGGPPQGFSVSAQNTRTFVGS